MTAARQGGNMGHVLFGWKAIQAHLHMSKAKIRKQGYPVMVREWDSPRVCADTEMLDEHTARRFREAVPYTPKRNSREE